MNRRLNWKKDHPDFRDPKYSAHPELKAAKPLPPMIDLRPKMSPVFDQGDLGSCTSQAIAGALEYLELVELREKIAPAQSPEIILSGAFVNLSRMFIYYNERLIDGDVTQDSGSTLRTGIFAVKQYGICGEALWGYDDHLTFVKPSSAAYGEGYQHRVPYHYSITDGMDHMKCCLVHGYPFVFGAMLYDSFMSDQVAATGNVPMPDPSENLQGGHAICAVGYDDSRRVFIVRNSWGDSWGDKGYFYLPYDYISNPGLCSDFWTLRRIP